VTNERWVRVKALFQAAVERPIEERGAFLAAATGDDEALRRDVESLLTSDTSDESFLRGLPVVREPGRTDHFPGPTIDRAPSRPVLTAGLR
jgi:serine/threonine-protein kinase